MSLSLLTWHWLPRCRATAPNHNQTVHPFQSAIALTSQKKKETYLVLFSLLLTILRFDSLHLQPRTRGSMLGTVPTLLAFRKSVTTKSAQPRALPHANGHPCPCPDQRGRDTKKKKSMSKALLARTLRGSFGISNRQTIQCHSACFQVPIPP